MLVIRLFLVGKKNQPFFKIVVIDKRRPPRGGRFVEELGNYNPLTKEKVLKTERIKYWLSVGAEPSKTVHNLLIKEKIIEGKKIDVHKKAKAKEVASAPAGATASQEPSSAKAMEGEEKPVEEKPKEEAVKESSFDKATEGKEKPKEKKKEDLSSEASAKEELPKTE